MQTTQPSAKPRLLDLFAGQGGASAGYVAAGFEVVGVDNQPQRHYPYRFVQADAQVFLQELLRAGKSGYFSAIHASPPCQAHSHTQRIRQNEHPDLIGPIRDLLSETGLPWVMENVPGAPLLDPVMLCGSMFPGLFTYRHRLFETNFELMAPAHEEHKTTQAKMGRALQPGDWYHAVGNFISVDYVRENLGVPWMTRNGIRECIPPVFAEYVGQQLRYVVDHNAARQAGLANARSDKDGHEPLLAA